jgi:hypothetical protein
MRRGRVPELGILLLGFQIFRNVGVANIPPVTLLAVLFQVVSSSLCPLMPKGRLLHSEMYWYRYLSSLKRKVNMCPWNDS